MAELSTLARPYAEALFEVARQEGVAEWSELLGAMAQVAALGDVRAAASDPRLPPGLVYEIFATALKRRLPPAAENLLRTLIDNERLALLPVIARQFEELRNRHEGVAEAEIVSAFALTPDQLAQVLETVQRRFGGARLKAKVRVDEGLIGGLWIRVGDRTLDASVRGQLERMRHALTG